MRDGAAVTRLVAVAVATAVTSAPGARTPLAAQTPPCDEAGWEAVVSEHLARYPLLGVEDAYVLLHQGVFGAGRMPQDVAAAAAALEEDLRALGTSGASDPVVEPIAPGGRLVRVHLRPYVAAGGDPEALLVALLQTTAVRRGGLDELRCAADVVERVAGARWSEGVWQAFVQRMLEERLPAIEHSQPFGAVYRPAYRVVAGDLLPTLEPRPR